MNRKDWVLLAVDSAGRQPLSPAKLQKSLFLLGERMHSSVGSEYYKFEPYDYGPFSAAIYADADELAVEDLIRINRDPSGRWREYAITPAGHERAKQVATEAGAAKAMLDKIVAWALPLTFQQLIRKIYDEFPHYKQNSVFRF